MNKYIIELLQTEGNIIIPKIGNLSASEGNISKILFNAYLKFDDGKLAKFIAEKEGIDTTEAANKLASFTREIDNQLDKGEEYAIFGLGTFFKNDEGEVDFKSDSSKAPKNDGTPPKKEEKKEEQPKQEKSSTPPKKEDPKKGDANPKKSKASQSTSDKKENKTTKKEEPKEESKSSDSDTTKKSSTSASEKKSKKETIISPHSKNEYKPGKENQDQSNTDGDKKNPLNHVAGDQEKDQKHSGKKEETKKTDPTKKKEKPSKKKKEKPVKEKKTPKNKDGKKKKKGWILWLIIILLLAAGGTYVGLEWQKVKTMIGLDTNKDEPENENKEVANEDQNTGEVSDSDSEEVTEDMNTAEDDVVDSTSTDDSMTQDESKDATEVDQEEASTETTDKESTTNSNSTSNTTTTASNPPSSPGGSYHIIGNSFEVPSNAENFAAGINGAQIIQYGRVKVVSVGSFSSQSEAQSALNEFMRQYPGAWILKR